MKKRLLITGSNGFIGKYLTEYYRNKYDVIGLDIIDDKNNLDNFIKVDISKKEDLEKALFSINFNYVIHCAAISHNREDENAIYNINVKGSNNLFEVIDSKEVESLIFFSSITVYGECGNNNFVTEKQNYKPISKYGRSKMLAEQKLSNYNYNHTIFRFPAIYTESTYNDIQKRILFKTFRNKEYGVVIGSGNQKHSFCFIKNIPVAIDLIFEDVSLTKHQIYHVADVKSYSTKDILEFCKSKNIVTNNRTINSFHFPKILFKLLLLSLGFITFRFKVFLSIYWKLANNNLYSVKKLEELGFKAESGLYY